ncbi:MAG: MFS transporter, partial [Bacteroidaceae bacterium]|nr:MFS transporter [Bacteroidaceae bacterium]
IAFTLSTKHFFATSLIFFMLAAFVSATHDIAADGFYILGLSEEKQSFFSGIRNTFYRIAMVFGSGVLVMLGGKLTRSCDNAAIGWGITIAIVALLMLLFSLYHKVVLPAPAEDISRKPKNVREIFKNFGHIIVTYFKKPGIVGALLFLLLFRLPEAQLVKMGKLFMLDPVASGGLGLATEQIGFINGVVGVLGLIIGGIAGGICVSRKGLKYWLWPMVIAISIPDLVYVYMSYLQPADIYTISSCIFIEQLGYGFGFTAYTLYMIYFAQGEYPTAHFAISTAFMSLGMMLPGIISGKIQQLIGYEHFFVWVMICCIVTFIVSALIKIDPEFGKKKNR